MLRKESFDWDLERCGPRPSGVSRQAGQPRVGRAARQRGAGCRDGTSRGTQEAAGRFPTRAIDGAVGTLQLTARPAGSRGGGERR